MNLKNMMQTSPAKISIITRLRGINPQNISKKEEKNNIATKNPQYTMFTLKNSSPSDILYISERPLDLIKINELKKLNSDSHTLNFLNFDKVYSQSFPLNVMYQQILQNSINDLFYKKNSCMFFFGPTLGGKSYLLRGSPFKNDNESGLLTRAIKEIFQRIEYNNIFCVKIAVYQIYLDKIYDLLSSNNDSNSELNIETNYSEINNVYNINIMGLTKKEIKDSTEYDLALREAINNRRNLAQKINVSDIKKKSNFIISVFLEKKNENSDTDDDNNNNNNNEFIPFSQFDFIELVSSNYGLLNESEDNISDTNEINGIDKHFYQNTNEVFNSIAENIICLSQDSMPNNETLLTLALKNTLKPNSNIIFVNCVIPWEFPLKDSLNSLKFTNMIFNQIYKIENNTNGIINNFKTNSTNNLTYSLDYSEKNIFRNINQNNLYNNQNSNINLSNSGYEKMNEYLNSLTIDKVDYLFSEKEPTNSNNNNNLTERNFVHEINDENNNNNIIYTKYTNNRNKKNIKSNKHNKNNNALHKNNHLLNKSYDLDKNSINKKNNKKKNNNNNIVTKKNNISFDKKEASPKEKRLKKLNEELKELEAKSNELNQNSNFLEKDILTNNINYIDYNSINEEKNKRRICRIKK